MYKERSSFYMADENCGPMDKVILIMQHHAMSVNLRSCSLQ